MFEKYGEFDAASEMNEAAAEKKQQGDTKALMELAEENGIDKEDVQDYIDGYTDTLVTPLSAALGKIKKEQEDLKLEKVLKDWVQELQVQCTEDELLARAVRKKGKGLDGYIALLASEGFKEKAVIGKRIVKLCSNDIKKIVGSHEFCIGIPDRVTRKKLMYQYYQSVPASGKKVKK